MKKVMLPGVFVVGIGAVIALLLYNQFRTDGYVAYIPWFFGILIFSCALVGKLFWYWQYDENGLEIVVGNHKVKYAWGSVYEIKFGRMPFTSAICIGTTTLSFSRFSSGYFNVMADVVRYVRKSNPNGSQIVRNGESYKRPEPK
jgi:hypothetical protein